MHAVKIETSLERISATDVLQIMRQAPWAARRTIAEVEEMLRNTRFVTLATIDGVPVGFARAVSDNVFRAFVEDVIVSPENRGTGIGTMMMEVLEEMVRRTGIPRMELVTQQPAFWSKVSFKERMEATYLIKWLKP